MHAVEVGRKKLKGEKWARVYACLSLGSERSTCRALPRQSHTFNRDLGNFAEGTSKCRVPEWEGQEQEYSLLRSKSSTVRDGTHPVHHWANLASGTFT